MAEDPDVIEPWYRKPLVIVGSLFLILLMVATVIPYYSVKADPEPAGALRLTELQIPAQNLSRTDGPIESFLMPTDPLVKNVATRIATAGCDSSLLCQAKSEFYFVRDNFVYVAEYDDYIQTPAEMLSTHGGDCDDHAVLLANLLRAIGVPTKFAYQPNHVYVKAYIADAPSKYKDSEGWIPLDATCKSCGFGETVRK
jgi:transglutaminase-like putative cysteine protease